MIRNTPKTKRSRVPRFSDRTRTVALFESKNRRQFVENTFRGTRLAIAWKHGHRFFRRFRVLTMLIRLTPWVLLLITTDSSRFLLTVFAVPLLLFLALFLLVFPFASHRKCDRIMKKELWGKTVYVLFLNRSGELSRGGFWQYNARSLATRPNSAVILVSPFLISPRGLSRLSFYRSFRREETNIFTVRQHYFFLLKSTILPECAKRSILIY